MRLLFSLCLLSLPALADTAEKFAALETRFEKEGRAISLEAVRNPASVAASYSGIRSGYCVDKEEKTAPYAFISEVRGKRVTWLIHSLKGAKQAEGGMLEPKYISHLKKTFYGDKSANRKLFTLPTEARNGNGISFFKTVALKPSQMKGDPAALQFFVKEGPAVFEGTKPDIFVKVTCEKAEGCDGEEKGAVVQYCRFAGARLQPW